MERCVADLPAGGGKLTTCREADEPKRAETPGVPAQAAQQAERAHARKAAASRIVHL